MELRDDLENLLWNHRCDILIELNNSEKAVYEAINLLYEEDYVTSRKEYTRELKAELKKMDRIIKYAYKLMGED